MTPEQAIQIVDQIIGQAPMARAGHVQAQQAVTLLQAVVTEAAAAALQVKAEEK